ncbi:MAG: UDP-N-acetylglucosamine 2-epimerase (non-hydrolyzing) [Coriobacteriaceae bacterium]|nr:UDP-N-acetylglucosamine 2-epimerase (non-hydrolyzing) [Coriobacteriaceae bacterium]
MSIAVVMGTRPEIIKLAPVVWALQDRHPARSVRTLLTGQHGTFAHDLCAELGIPVDEDLGIQCDHPSELLGRAVQGADAWLRRIGAEAVVVQGDTTSVLAGALAGFYRRLPVAHVEAGLRTGDLTRPFPEEGNRRLVGGIARMHFAPTELARRRLLAENVDPARIVVVGNTVVDAVRRFAGGAASGREPGTRRALVTIHRRESWGGEFEDLCLGVADLADAEPDLHVDFVMHPNPALQSRARETLGHADRIRLLEPMTYVPFVQLLASADVVLTDSGGIQEESVSLGKPLVVLREVTERPEGVSAGVAFIGGVTREGLARAAEDALALGETSDRDLYGDGRAGERIADMLAAGRMLPELAWQA